MQFVCVAFEGAEIPLAAIRLPAGTFALSSGHFLDQRLADPFPMAPNPQTTKTSITAVAVVPTRVFALINITSSAYNLTSGLLLSYGCYCCSAVSSRGYR